MLFSLNLKRIILLAIINYFIKKYIRDFDQKVLKKPEDDFIFICKNCTRLIYKNSFVSFDKVSECIYCGNEFQNISNHLSTNNKTSNKRLLKL